MTEQIQVLGRMLHAASDSQDGFRPEDRDPANSEAEPEAGQ